MIDPVEEGSSTPQPQQPTAPQPQPTPVIPDSPDRALSIVSELKSNAALFAAFAYGGLSIPSTLTVTEAKVTSVTTSISTARPLPANELIQSFVLLDTVTLCLMISCVAASQLLIYRLTDGSWYEEADASPTSPAQNSAMSRLVTDYGVEFTVARTTFDLGLVALLLAVAVRAIAIFDASISLPIVVLLGGTCVLLAVAYLQSYRQVFRPLEHQSKQTEKATAYGYAGVILPASTALVLTAAATFFYSTLAPQDSSTTTMTTPNTLSETLRSYSSAAGEAKLKMVVDKVAREKGGQSTTSGRKTTTKTKDKSESKKTKSLEGPSEDTTSGTVKKSRATSEESTNADAVFTSKSKSASKTESKVKDEEIILPKKTPEEAASK